MPLKERRALRLLISFDPTDGELKDQLVQHLRILVRFAGIDLWSAEQIRPGDDWREEIAVALSQADIALLLISANFLASDFLQDGEVAKLFERHANGGVKVIPVLLRSCLWQVHPWLGTLNALPASRKPVASFRGNDRDRALTEVAAQIAECAGTLSINSEITGELTHETANDTGNTTIDPTHSLRTPSFTHPDAPLSGGTKNDVDKVAATAPEQGTPRDIAENFVIPTRSIALTQGPFAVIEATDEQYLTLIKKFPFRIGRSPGLDYTLSNVHASRIHALIHRDGHRFVIEDANSSLGTHVNGIRISRYALRYGDLISVAWTRIKFKIFSRSTDAEREIHDRKSEFLKQKLNRTPLFSIPPIHDSEPDSDFTRALRRIMNQDRSAVCFVRVERALMYEQVYGTGALAAIWAHIIERLSFELPQNVAFAKFSDDEIALLTMECTLGRLRGAWAEIVQGMVPQETSFGSERIRFKVHVSSYGIDEALARAKP